MQSTTIPFLKMNGCGNDFLIFDRRNAHPLHPSRQQLAQLADRESGPGCDQIIAIENSVRGDVFMRIWNADGGEVNACGNATRCVAWLILEERKADRVRIETEADILLATRQGNLQVSVEFPSPLLKWEEIPLSERMDTRRLDVKVGPIDAPILFAPGAVNVGNPHCVFFHADVESLRVDLIGPLIENHPLFPERVNVGFAQIMSPDHIRLRVWERGAGVTKACGTGACAALVAASRRGFTGRSARIQMDGGDLHVEWRELDDHLILTGPVMIDHAGEVFLSN